MAATENLLIATTKGVPKIHIVILSEAKNLMFFLFKSKNQKRDPSDFVLRMTER
jgi:hypothetical protein